MDLGFLKTLREEWPTVSAAPWSFGITSVVALGFGFAVSTLWWSGTVSTLRERVSLYQDRLQGASPDQAAQKITDLTTQLAVLQNRDDERHAKDWPILSPKQMTEWASKLSHTPVTFLAVFFSDEHSEMLRENLYEVFRRANWPNPTVVNAGHGMGLMIKARNDEPAAVALIALFNGWGYAVKLDSEGESTPGRLQFYVWTKP